jgi:hypothetical protein
MSEVKLVCAKHGNLFLTRGLTRDYCGLCRRLEQYAQGKRAALVGLALLAILGSCRSTTAPESDPAHCSLTLPSGNHLCFTPCPPGTKAWAANTPLPYAPVSQC